MKKAIDVSVYQGVIDWDQVKADGVEFAIIRGGLGDDYVNQDDKYFERNWAECQRVGIPCTMYLFSYATDMNHLKSELQHIKRLMSGKAMNCYAPIYIDIENTAGLNWRSITNETLLELMKAYKQGLADLGYNMGIYSSRAVFWNEKMSDPWYQNNVSIWVAEYASQVNNFNRPYDIWQYSSNGSVRGISGRVDMNWLYKDFAIPSSNETTTTAPVNITYQSYDETKKKWLPNVVNRTDFAGNAGHPASAFYISADVGNIYYRSRVMEDERWLPEVKNREDYAGILSKPADGIMIRSDVATIHYQVELVDGTLLPPVTGYDANDLKNGYAGVPGKAISKLWVWADLIEVTVVTDEPIDSPITSEPVETTAPPEESPIITDPPSEEPVIEDPVVDGPAGDEPVIDTPPVEDPIDEPSQDEPKEDTTSDDSKLFNAIEVVLEKLFSALLNVILKLFKHGGSKE